MSTVETPELPQVQETPKLEVLDFLRANGYELVCSETPINSRGFFIWDIYRGVARDYSKIVGAIFYNPDNPSCNRGSISLYYDARKKTDENGTTEISLNLDQIESIIEFRRFLDSKKREYSEQTTLYDGKWAVGEIAKFFGQEGLVQRLGAAARELENEPVFKKLQRAQEES